MTEPRQVHRDHVQALGQWREHRLPHAELASDPVQEDHRLAAAGPLDVETGHE